MDTVRFLTAGADGGNLKSFLALGPGTKPAISLKPGRAMNVTAGQPWNDGDAYLLDPTGDGAVQIGRSAKGNRPLEYQVVRISARGDTVFRVSIPYQAPPVTQADVETWLGSFDDKRLISAFGSKGALTKALLAALFRPQYLPPPKTGVIGTDGTVWLQRLGTGSKVTYDAILATGATRAVAEVGSGYRVIAAGNDVVWLWSDGEDGDGSPVLVRSRIVRSAKP